MSLPILTTKLFIPTSRPDLVPRKSLIERLNTGFSRKLTLISAPAGFGKSTILSDWAEQIESAHVAWLSLDEGDNDLARFLTYFVSALKTIEIDIGQTVLAAVQSPGIPNTEIILTTLLNEITEYSGNLVLILDDYHVIDSKPIDHVLNFMLDHLPANMHLVIATRVDPPLPLARLRARGHMTELRTADLRFTKDETTAFLNQVMDFELSAEDITALETRTEGWIAGLQMAVVSMRSLKDIPTFIKNFAGDHRHIVDYLVDEVLAQCSPEIRDFLLKTSILKRMTAPLCNAVTETSNGQYILEKLEQDNLFTFPLDQKRVWYRYHHLFADLLRYRLTQSYPEQIELLHARASFWLTENEFPNQAITHALKMDDKTLAAELIEHHARDLLHLGKAQVKDMQSWFDLLPEMMIQERPLLHIYQAWMLVYANPFKHKNLIERILSKVQETLNATDVNEATKRTIAGHVAGISGLLSQPPLQPIHDPHKTLALFDKAIRLFPVDEVKIRCGIHLGIAYEQMHLENTQAAIDANQNAFEEARAANNDLIAVIALRNQIMIFYHAGELVQAIATCQNSLIFLNQISTEKGQAFLGIEILSIVLGFMYVERGDFEKARIKLTEGLEALELFNEYEAISLVHIALVRLLLLVGDMEGAKQIVEQFKHRREMHAGLANILQIKVDLSDIDEGNSAALGTVRSWIRENQPRFESISASQGITPWAETQHLAYITWIHAQIILLNRDSEPLDISVLHSCLDYLERCILATIENGLIFRCIEFCVLKALVLIEIGNLEEAVNTISKALLLAAPEGYRRVFLDKGQPMIRLLKSVAANDVSTDFVQSLLSILEQSGDVKSFPIQQNLIEPLSDRELEVLCLIAEGLTYNEIAGQIMVSLNTVRTHVKNIYSKLFVHKRSKAIAKAKELNIL